MSETSGGGSSGDWANFMGSGAAMVGAGVAFRAAPNLATGTALFGSIATFYSSTQTPTVRNAFGNQYDRLNTAANGLQQEMANNPRQYWNPGRSGL